MALSRNRNEKFLVFFEGKEGPKGKVNRLFLPEGDKVEGWWQMMEALHEVVGVKLIPSDWVTKKKCISMNEVGDKMMKLAIVIRCLGCNIELELRLEKRHGVLFAEILSQPVWGGNWVEQEETGQKDVGRVKLNIENRSGGGHVSLNGRELFNGKMMNGLEGERIIWAEGKKETAIG